MNYLRYCHFVAYRLTLPNGLELLPSNIGNKVIAQIVWIGHSVTGQHK
jgi:hypothetical protein